MAPHMLVQCTGVTIRFIAVGACKRFLACMNTGVISCRSPVLKLFVTVLAAVRSFASMTTCMCIQVRLGFEFFLTLPTAVRSFASMNSNMDGQGPLFRARFSTNAAAVRSLLLVVFRFVHTEQVARRKRLVALCARNWRIVTVVLQLMLPPTVLRNENFLARVATELFARGLGIGMILPPVGRQAPGVTAADSTLLTNDSCIFHMRSFHVPCHIAVTRKCVTTCAAGVRLFSAVCAGVHSKLTGATE
jgi:hypothetical protein